MSVERNISGACCFVTGQWTREQLQHRLYFNAHRKLSVYLSKKYTIGQHRNIVGVEFKI